jgi:hypothetical protein
VGEEGKEGEKGEGEKGGEGKKGGGKGGLDFVVVIEDAVVCCDCWASLSLCLSLIM